MKKATKRRIKGPSAASLAEMPERSFKGAKRSRVAQEVAKAGGYFAGPDGEEWVSVKRGRPEKGEKRVAMESHSVRVPPELWKALSRAAEKRDMSKNDIVVQVLSSWVNQEKRKASA